MTSPNENLAIQESGADLEESQQDKYLTFIVAEEEYGIDIRFVTEIIGLQKITEIPDLPGFIRGVINLRGKIIPVMDMRARFGLADREYDHRTCTVVVDIEGKTMGLIVDRVSEVVDIPAEQIEPPPRTSKGGCRYIQGIGKLADSIKILLDVNLILSKEEQLEIADLKTKPT